MRVVLLGAPGAGKGTQCKRIVEKYGLQHLSSGDILRKERAAGTELGKQAQSYMDSGGLVPDELIVSMMAGAIGKAADSGFVLDGFPRTVNQADELDKSLSQAGQKVDVVLNLVVDEQVVFERMGGRRSCPKCGQVYHVVNLKPVTEGVCDNDGTELVQRTDDKREVVEKRLKAYHELTKPVVDYYKKNNTVFDFAANGTADDVNAQVSDKLDSLVTT